MKRPTDMHGVVALVLSIGIMLTLVIAATAAAIRGRQLSDDELGLVSTIVGVAIGAVATYLGSGRRPPDG